MSVLDLFSWFFGHRSKPITGHAEPNSPEIRIDAQGWLHGPGVTTYPSVRWSPMTVDEPLGVVWHYTATDPGTGRRLAKRIRKYRRGKDRANSWSILITTKGEIFQSVSCLEGAWHCAVGRLPDELGKRHKINWSTIGIELEGHGEEFPQAQVAATEKVVRALVWEYEIERGRLELQHSQFDPKRRSDAGPVWMRHLKDILDRVFASDVLDAKYE